MTTLNRQQAAAYLHMHPITLLQKVHAGIIPAAKPAKSWVFLVQDLEDYLRANYQQNKQPASKKGLQPISEITKPFANRSNYNKLLGISDCPQIHSPQPDRVVAQATQTKRIRSRSEAVGLVVKSPTMSQSNCG
jgi:Helix-turn-helix domain